MSTIFIILIATVITWFLTDLYRKNSASNRSQIIPEELREFADTFNHNQKATIIFSLMMISRSTDKVRNEEIELVGQTSRILGIADSDPTLKRISTLDSKSIVEILSSLNENQKQWFVLTIHSLVFASGGNDDKFNYGLGICEKIGISEEDYIEIVNKTEALMRTFKLK